MATFPDKFSTRTMQLFWYWLSLWRVNRWLVPNYYAFSVWDRIVVLGQSTCCTSSMLPIMKCNWCIGRFRSTPTNSSWTKNLHAKQKAASFQENIPSSYIAWIGVCENPALSSLNSSSFPLPVLVMVLLIMVLHILVLAASVWSSERVFLAAYSGLEQK